MATKPLTFRHDGAEFELLELERPSRIHDATHTLTDITSGDTVGIKSSWLHSNYYSVRDLDNVRYVVNPYRMFPSRNSVPIPVAVSVANAVDPDNVYAIGDDHHESLALFVRLLVEYRQDKYILERDYARFKHPEKSSTIANHRDHIAWTIRRIFATRIVSEVSEIDIAAEIYASGVTEPAKIAAAVHAIA